MNLRIRAITAIAFAAASLGLSHPNSADTASNPSASSYFHFIVGSLESLDNDPKEALDHFRLASRYDPSSKTLIVKQAEQLVNLNRIDEAKSLVEDPSIQNEASTDIYLLNARIATTEGDLKEVSRNLDQATQVFLSEGNEAKAREAVLTKVATLADNKQYDESVRSLEKYLESNSDDEIAFYFLGKIHALFQNREASKQALKEALKLRPNFTAASKALGLQLELEGKTSEAFQVYQKAYSVSGNDEELLQKLVNISLMNDEYTMALDYLNQWLAINPTDAQNQMRAALIHYKLKNFDEAKSIFEDMLQNQDIAHDRIYFYLGTLLEEQSNPLKALNYYQKVNASSDYYVESQLQVAYIYTKGLKQPQKALQSLSEAVALRSDSPDLFIALAAQHEMQNQIVQGVRVLTRAADFFKENEKVIFMLGTLLDRVGNYEAGIAKMRDVLKLNPNNPHALNHIGYSYASRKVHLDEAEELLKKAVQLEPTSGSIMDSLGWLYFQKGQFKKAYQILSKANELAPNQPVILEHLADAAEHAGQKQEALDIYRRIMAWTNEATNSIADAESNKETRNVQDRVREKLALLDDAHTGPDQ